MAVQKLSSPLFHPGAPRPKAVVTIVIKTTLAPASGPMKGVTSCLRGNHHGGRKPAGGGGAAQAPSLPQGALHTRNRVGRSHARGAPIAMGNDSLRGAGIRLRRADKN